MQSPAASRDAGTRQAQPCSGDIGRACSLFRARAAQSVLLITESTLVEGHVTSLDRVPSLYFRPKPSNNSDGPFTQQSTGCPEAEILDLFSDCRCSVAARACTAEWLATRLNYGFLYYFLGGSFQTAILRIANHPLHTCQHGSSESKLPAVSASRIRAATCSTRHKWQQRGRLSSHRPATGAYGE